MQLKFGELAKLTLTIVSGSRIIEHSMICSEVFRLSLPNCSRGERWWKRAEKRGAGEGAFSRSVIHRARPSSIRTSSGS